MTTDDVLKEFIDGKTIYTIAKTDGIARLDAAIANGEVAEIPQEETEEGQEEEEAGEEAQDTGETGQTEAFYGIAKVPDLTDQLQTKGLSVTNSVVVNAYSGHRDRAKEFARYITYEKVGDLYVQANKMPVKIGVQYENDQMQVLIDQYEDSVEVPKITELSNYWIWMEITFADIWKGNDVYTEMQSIVERVQAQVAQ